MQKLEQERTLNEQIRKELPQAVPKRAVGSSALGGLSGLPELNTKGGLGFKKPKLDDLEKKRGEIQEKLEISKLQMDPAALEERKAQLKEQREKLLEAKRKEREAQLMKYEQLEVNVALNFADLLVQP